MMSPAHFSIPSRGFSVAALITVVALLFVLATPRAQAAEDPAPPAETRWSVVPATPAGADGRTAVEHTLDPGASVDEFFAVRNVGDSTVTFRLTAADGFFTRTGRFDILPAGQPSTAAGAWIALAESVDVGAGQTVIVPFRITVPVDAEPGDHAAGITASVMSGGREGDDSAVSVDTRVGFRVTTRVSGELVQKASVQGLSGDYDLSWNPLRPGTAVVTFHVVNEGNTRLRAAAVASAGTQSGSFPLESQRIELLPGDSRSIAVTVDDVWPTLVVPLAVRLDAVAVTMDDAESALPTVSAQSMLWAIPWPQLVSLAGVAMIVLALVLNRRRTRRAVATLVAQAREEGRRSATAHDKTP